VENGLLILTAKEKLRIMPPLNISKEEIDTGFNILRKCLSGALS
jgi:acetylornithine/N-succinyldiaminopimelate aminotransferase